MPQAEQNSAIEKQTLLKNQRSPVKSMWFPNNILHNTTGFAAAGCAAFSRNQFIR